MYQSDHCIIGVKYLYYKTELDKLVVNYSIFVMRKQYLMFQINARLLQDFRTQLCFGEGSVFFSINIDILMLGD